MCSFAVEGQPCPPLQVRDIDAHLTELQAADCRAYCALLLGVLAEVESWVFWVDPVHYSDVIWPLISRTVLAPLRWFVPGVLRRRHAAALAQAGWGDVHILRSAAQDAYVALATRLSASSGPFLFGDRMTSADALLYGHLSAVRHAVPGEWAASACGGALLRAYASVRHALFEPPEAGGGGHHAPSPLLLLRGTTGPSNLLDALAHAIDARRLKAATTVHSRHHFARTTNALALLPSPPGGGGGGAAEAQSHPERSAPAGGGGGGAWAALSSVLAAGGGGAASSSSFSSSARGGGQEGEGGDEGPLSVQRWGFGADRRMLARAVGAVRRSADGGSSAAVTWDLLFAGAMAALAVAALRSLAGKQ